MNPLIQLKTTILPVLITFVLGCFALSPAAQAPLPPPPPDGGYPNGNTAEGARALFNLTTGTENTAVGLEALFKDRSGGFNTATGSFALHENTTGNSNTANGVSALSGNTVGNLNTATGFQALSGNTTGSDNTATGLEALFNNDSGSFNTASGVGALSANTTGGNNTASGLNALSSNTTGSSNIGLGVGAGINLTTGNNNIDIGNEGIAGESNVIRIGTQGTQNRTFIVGISGSPIAGTSVVVNANGRLGTVASSRRFKDDIKSMDKDSEAILVLKPVTFRYKREIDPNGTPEFGLVAEDVEAINPDLVVRDKEGKPYSVRYEAVNAMLVNEFLKEHRTVQEQGATIALLQKQIEALAGLQKVSAQLEASKPATQVVNNNQ